MKPSPKFLQVAACAAIIVLLGVPASAQRGKWWQDERFAGELALTPDQRTRLEEIFQKTLPTLRAKMKALDDAQTQFDELVEQGDDASVMSQVETVEAARVALSKTRTMMLLRMRRSLTTDQWAKFTALHAASARDRDRDRQRSPDRPK